MNKMQNEYARRNIETLSKTFHLSPRIKEMYANGEIPLSCSIQFVGTVLRTLSEVPMYEKIVRDFEKRFDAHVYYCLPSSGFVTLLYVGKDENEQEMFAPQIGEKTVWAAVYNGTYGIFDFGDVILDSKAGVLLRVG